MDFYDKILFIDKKRKKCKKLEDQINNILHGVTFREESIDFVTDLLNSKLFTGIRKEVWQDLDLIQYVITQPLYTQMKITEGCTYEYTTIPTILEAGTYILGLEIFHTSIFMYSPNHPQRIKISIKTLAELSKLSSKSATE